MTPACSNFPIMVLIESPVFTVTTTGFPGPVKGLTLFHIQPDASTNTTASAITNLRITDAPPARLQE